MVNDKISKILNEQDVAYIYCYNDYTESKNYPERDSYFHNMTPAEVLVKSTKDAMKHGLTSENIMEYLEGSSAWQILNEGEKNQILKDFKIHEGQDMEMAITDLVDKAYRENDTFSFTELADMHGRILKMATKDSMEYIKKFQKPVILSLVKELKPKRISYPGERSTIIIGDDIYIRSRNSEIYFSSSSNGTIRTMLNQIYNHMISSRTKDEVIRQIQDLCQVVDFESATRYIKFKNNFVFDTQTQNIIAFTPDLFIIRKFEFNYEPAAKCEQWLKFLNSSIAPEDIPVLQEFFGYVFYYGLPAQNFLILKGPTRSGKGTTLRVLQSLIGAGNFSAVPASFLFSRDDSGHNLASLEGKMVNIDGEVPPKDLLNIANLKKLTGVDPIWANEKYKIPHSFQYTGKLIFALNSLPKIKLNDQEIDSFFSRVLIINYLNSHIDDQNTNLDKELSEELPGIFNWAMEGLKRLKTKKFRFSSNQNLEEKQRLYTLESDPLKVFSDEQIIPGDCQYKPNELYNIFLAFCNNNKIEPSMNVKNLRSFQLQISGILKARDDLNFTKKSEGHENITFYTGFCINTEENEAGEKNTHRYFKVNRNFDKYGLKFFKEMDMTLEVTKKHFKDGDATETAYTLLDVFMPEYVPARYTKRWLQFTRDADEIKKETYDMDSRGDAE